MVDGNGLFGGDALKDNDDGKIRQLPGGLFDDEDDFKKDIPPVK